MRREPSPGPPHPCDYAHEWAGQDKERGKSHAASALQCSTSSHRLARLRSAGPRVCAGVREWVMMSQGPPGGLGLLLLLLLLL